jgi:hypothetical protein
MVGFNYTNRNNEPSNKYSQKVGKWVDVFAHDGIYSGKLEKITTNQFILNPAMTVSTNDEGWAEYKLKKVHLEMDLAQTKAMRNTTKKSILNYCVAQNKTNRQVYFLNLERLGLIKLKKQEDGHTNASE